LCPACQRVRDRVPAGYLTLSGAFLASHREEIEHLIDNHAQRQGAEHPLKRIMAREDTADGLLITTTDAHLARSLGEAVHHAYRGDLDYHYADDDTTLRVHWQRAA
jgi:NMD protein affecting ribosome stability and mRNA decay